MKNYHEHCSLAKAIKTSTFAVILMAGIFLVGCSSSPSSTTVPSTIPTVSDSRPSSGSDNSAVATYTVTVQSSPEVGGTVTGQGSYKDGTNVTVQATAKSGYYFTGWKKDTAIVSTDANYSFTVSENCILTAVFEKYPDDPNYALALMVGADKNATENKVLASYATTFMSAYTKLLSGTITNAEYTNIINSEAEKVRTELSAQGVSENTNYFEFIITGSDINAAALNAKKLIVSSGYDPSKIAQYGFSRYVVADTDGKTVCLVFGSLILK